jgi:hypothetical protein
MNLMNIHNRLYDFLSNIIDTYLINVSEHLNHFYELDLSEEDSEDESDDFELVLI